MADVHTIARPYAEAVFELARDRGTLGDWEGLLEVLAAIAADPAMERLLTNPRIPAARKEEVFRSVAGDRLGSEGVRLLAALFANDRVELLPDILESFRDLRREAEGEVHAVVTSAEALSPELERAIADRLGERLGKRVSVESRVDEGLLAGMVIRAGDLVIDGSVRGGLEQLRNQLKA